MQLNRTATPKFISQKCSYLSSTKHNPLVSSHFIVREGENLISNLSFQKLIELFQQFPAFAKTEIRSIITELQNNANKPGYDWESSGSLKIQFTALKSLAPKIFISDSHFFNTIIKLAQLDFVDNLEDQRSYIQTILNQLNETPISCRQVIKNDCYEYQGQTNTIGEPSGYGVLKYLIGQKPFVQGDVFQGQFINGTPGTYGHIQYANKDTYTGTLTKEGIPKGLGKYITKENEVFEADFMPINGNLYIIRRGAFDDKTVPLNAMKFANGNLYVGEFHYNTYPHGSGRMKYANGDIFTGKFHQGLPKIVSKELDDSLIVYDGICEKSKTEFYSNL